MTLLTRTGSCMVGRGGFRGSGYRGVGQRRKNRDQSDDWQVMIILGKRRRLLSETEEALAERSKVGTGEIGTSTKKPITRNRFVRRHRKKFAGVLSCFDRVVAMTMGTLPDIGHTGGIARVPKA